jgi:hypothetical protein
MQGDESAEKQTAGLAVDFLLFRGFDSFFISQASVVYFPGVIEEGHLTGGEKEVLLPKITPRRPVFFTSAGVCFKKFYISYTKEYGMSTVFRY